MLTGNEDWVKAAVEGQEVWAKPSCCDWWPIVHIELDCELLKIDVCNRIQICHLDDCEIRIGQDDIVEDVYLETKGI
jgi:hypothetical protein